MTMYDLILKKKRGGELTKDEIEYMISGYTKGSIPDYQMSAMMMAICFQGMTPEETKDLTLAMAHSGEMLDLSAIIYYLSLAAVAIFLTTRVIEKRRWA